MKKITLPLLALIPLMNGNYLNAQYIVKPTHVFMVMEENYAYDEIIGSPLAPTLNYVSQQSYTALFDDYFAIEHPSEPNYLDLFSGTNQGITSDISGQGLSGGSGDPLTTCNLGASLIQKGYTFAGYSEDQPTLAWYDNDDPPYYTKHCPWINWIDCPNNDSILQVDDIPYSYLNGYSSGPIFPDSSHYDTLPTVTWIIPNSIDDMHDGSIPDGDTWFHSNMMPLVRWCSNPANNSVLFVTWDEDDGTESNKVVMMACSGIINGGTYSTALNHYGWLRTIEEMYSLTECSNSATATAFPNAMWKANGVNSINKPSVQIATWPVPANNVLNVKITSDKEYTAMIDINDVTGRTIKESNTHLVSGENNIVVNTCDISAGVYSLTIKGNNLNISKKIEIVK